MTRADIGLPDPATDAAAVRSCLDISVIIPTYDRPAALARCLEALAHQTLPRECFEVIVCDDGSPAAVAGLQADLVSRMAPDLDVRLLHQSNAGPAIARNLGAGEARGRYLAFTDDDCRPSSDWLERLLARFRHSPDVLLGGGMRNGLESDRHAAATHAIMDYVYEEQGRSTGARLFSTSNLSLPRAGFEAIGGFSAEFPDAAGEDYDLCWRWHESGRAAEYAPEAVITHYHALSFRSYVRQHFNYGRGLLRVRMRRSARAAATQGTGVGRVLRIVLHPLRRSWTLAAWRSALLIGVSQFATACGAAAESVRPSRPRSP